MQLMAFQVQVMFQHFLFLSIDIWEGLLKIELRVLGKCSITELYSQPSLHLSIDLCIHIEVS